MRRHLAFVLTAVIACIALQNAVAAQESSLYVEQVHCEGGPYGLLLPKSLTQVMRLGPVLKQEVQEVEQWDGYAATRKYIFFSGLILGLVTFSNEPERYIVSFAEVSSPSWNNLLPFKIGDSVTLVRKKLGAAAANDAELTASYESESDSVAFQSSAGKLLKVTYDCYTG